jgi:hypothetical protein
MTKGQEPIPSCGVLRPASPFVRRLHPLAATSTTAVDELAGYGLEFAVHANAFTSRLISALSSASVGT